MYMEQEVRDSTQRVLDVAETLFMDRGYNAITLRDIADELGIKQASLYYHFPGGKEQLFMAMAERMFDRHRQGIMAALEAGKGDLRAQLREVAEWFSSQRPVKFMGMMHADLAALNPEHKEQLARKAHAAMFRPLRDAFVAAQVRGEIRPMHPDLLAGSFLWLMDGLNYGETRSGAPPRQVMAEELISLLLDGLLPRQAEPAVAPATRG
ncbi:MAG TPA: TetR/AcrR family transcriptional regulator [Chloroflexi bacterium]|nr:TetR/AcrR family transcriptional regulator [Chloroflexota bacterium]